MSTPRWVTLAVAAGALDMTAPTLRRTIERRARRAGDGVLEAAFDGVRARKFAGRWRVSFGPGWQCESVDKLPRGDAARATSSPRPKHASRPEKE